MNSRRVVVTLIGVMLMAGGLIGGTVAQAGGQVCLLPVNPYLCYYVPGPETVLTVIEDTRNGLKQTVVCRAVLVLVPSGGGWIATASTECSSWLNSVSPAVQFPAHLRTEVTLSSLGGGQTYSDWDPDECDFCSFSSATAEVECCPANADAQGVHIVTFPEYVSITVLAPGQPGYCTKTSTYEMTCNTKRSFSIS